MTDDFIPLNVILPVTSIGIFLTALDGSIVNVTLPVIAEALKSDVNAVSWVAVIYLLTLASFMGLGGALGDSYGRKKIFQMGMFIFGLGSFLCSISPTLHLLVGARVIQAIGAIGIQANGLALVVTYIEPSKRGRAIGLNSLVVAMALSIGPPLGGVLTEHFGWESVFWINIPISLFGILMVQRTIPETSIKTDVNLDYIGVILFAMTAFFLISGMKFSLDGYVWTVIFLILTPFVGYLFVKHENKHPNPVLSIRLMKNKQIMFGALAAIFSFMGINAATILLPFYFKDILGFSQIKIGLSLVVIPLALSFMGPPAGFLAEKFNTRLLATLGAALMTIFTFILGFILIISKDLVPTWQILLFVGLTAAFLSFFSNPNGTRVMDSSKEDELSIVSGILNLARNVGFTLGTSLSPALFVLFRDNFSKGLTTDQAYVNALGWTFIVFGFFALLGTIFSYLRGEEGLIHRNDGFIEEAMMIEP